MKDHHPGAIVYTQPTEDGKKILIELPLKIDIHKNYFLSLEL